MNNIIFLGMQSTANEEHEEQNGSTKQQSDKEKKTIQPKVWTVLKYWP